LILILISSGCAQTDVRIVKINDFCERYDSQILQEKDYDNIEEVRKNKIFKITIDKIIDNKAVNEKEFEYCKQ